MRDFDAELGEAIDQGFTVKGESFRVNPGVHPSVLLNYEESDFLGRADLLAAIDTAINAFLADDDARARWKALRERDEDPVTVGHLRAIMAYLYEVESDLPTIARASSSGGRSRKQDSSEDVTSSPVGAAS